jgi:acyl-CoA oxidase
MNSLLQSLRKVAVNIVDAFDIPDASLKSTLGAFDGRVYERMFEAAMKGPLNKTDVPDTFHKHIKPLFKAHL